MLQVKHYLREMRESDLPPWQQPENQSMFKPALQFSQCWWVISPLPFCTQDVQITTWPT